MNKPDSSAVERRLGEISQGDQIVRVLALVTSEKPFVIDDGSGRAVVNAPCSYREGDRLRIIGYASLKENNKYPEIDPIVIQNMGNLDLDLYSKLQGIKARLTIGGRDGK